MLYADALRGWDSTGIAAIHINNSVDVIKDACQPGILFHRYPEHDWIHSNQALVGHNRFATKGKTNKENAHPFTEGPITLVHNGTLRFHHHLKDVEVDSHAITHSIAERGATATIALLQGAFALVWFDASTGLLHAARNNERTLYIIETEELYILSSEEGLATWICERNKQTVIRTQLLTAGLLYTFKTNKKKTRYLHTERVTLCIDKPPEIPKKPTEITHFPNNKVSQIQPYKDDEENFEGLKVGQSLNVLAFINKNLSYATYGMGKNRWLADCPEHPELMVEFYTDSEEDFLGCMVNINIVRLYYSHGMKKNFVIGDNPVIPQKKSNDHTGAMRTSNGIELTDQVLNFCKNKYCEGCTIDFSIEDGMVLEPVIINGHIYNYRYTCASCKDYDLMTRRVHK